VGRLRNRFRQQIVPEKYDEYSINYREDYEQYQQFRKNSVRKAAEMLELKKSKSKNNKNVLSSPIRGVERPKSKESVWREENVESNDSRVKEQTQLFFFHIDVGSRKV
jgi:hypothetical protein